MVGADLPDMKGFDLVDEIALFTDLGAYLDMPIRTYSAGMLTRLAFAVATSIDPEILLMDEWIAAGDADAAEAAMRTHLDNTLPALHRSIARRNADRDFRARLHQAPVA